MANSIWTTNKESTNTEEILTQWSSRGSSGDTDDNPPPTCLFETQYVSKPMPIFTSILSYRVEFNKYLKEVILEHRRNNPNSTDSNVKAWHSSWMTHQENPKFQPLCDLTVSACKFISRSFMGCQDLNFEVFNFWAMMYEEDEHTIRHSHFPSDFSAVYYVDVEPGCAPLIFENVVKDGVNDNNQPLIIQPENGMLAIWPSILHHEVPPTKGRRMCISMNIDKGERK